MTAPACDAYDAQKIEVVATVDSRAQDGTPIETAHFRRSGRTITREEFAALYEAETGSDDIARYKIPSTYGFTVLGLSFLAVGIAATATGGVLLLATDSSSGAHTAGWVTLVAGLALWVPSPYIIMGGTTKELSGYGYDIRTARALADAYDRALERRIAAQCATTQKPARVVPVLSPGFTGLVVRF